MRGNILRLFVVLSVLAFVVYVLAPIPLKHVGALREYAQIVRENDITPGALYYTDVAQSSEAEMSNRDSIRYFVRNCEK